MTLEFPIWQQNKGYSARLDRQLIAALWDEGVMDVASCKVTQTGNGDMTVTVSIGEAVVEGDDQPDQGSYLVKVTSEEVAAVPVRPGSNSRLDLVVLRVNDSNAGSSAEPADVAVIEVIAGTPSSTPVAPNPPESAIVLAVIGPITPSTVAITNSIITEARTLAGRKCAPGTSESYTGSEGWIPNGWLVEGGQAVSRTKYPRLNALYAALGYPYGAGDGSTTFNVRDKRGRVGVGLDNMGGSDAGRLAGANTLGRAGGAETVVLTQAQIPAHGHVVDPPWTPVGISDPGHKHNIDHGHPGSSSHSGSPHSHGVGTLYTVYAGTHTHRLPGLNHMYGGNAGGGSAFAAVPAGQGDYVGSSTYLETPGDHVHQLAGDTGGENSHTHGLTITGASPREAVGAGTGIQASVDIAPFGSQETGGNGAHANLQPYILELSIVRT
jgi:microcystin-dependent protein